MKWGLYMVYFMIIKAAISAVEVKLIMEDYDVVIKRVYDRNCSLEAC